MKKIWIIALSIAMASCASGQKENAQDKNKDVPAAVKEKFVSLYPDVKNEKWDAEDGNFEAEFSISKTETSVLFDKDGNVLETETEMNPSDLPAPVLDYCKTNMPDKKIKEASKIVDSKGKVTFEAEVDKVDYIFDDSGNLLSNKQDNSTDSEDAD